MIFELLDIETGNRITSYPSEEAALRSVRLTLEEMPNGSEVVSDWALLMYDEAGRVSNRAQRQALIDLALNSAPA